jgi:glutathione peroxidase
VIDNIYEYKHSLTNGTELDFSELKGRVILVVNTASKCGFTPQYEQLEQIYLQYKDKGFIVLGFPANDFLFQEPGSNEEIASFCKINYGVTFPIFSKSHVKGREINDLFNYLTNQSEFKGQVKWNFEKFLINKEGKLIKRFSSAANPDSDEITKSIEELIS